MVHYPPGAPRRSTLRSRSGAFARELVRESREDRILFLSSALTFDALMASVPLMMLVLAAVSFVFERMGGGQLDLHGMLGAAIPQSGTAGVDPLQRVERLLAGVAERRASVSALSLPLLVFLSTRVFATVRTVLNQVFHASSARRLVHRKLVDIALLALTVVFVLTNGIASVWIGILTTGTGGQWLARTAGGAITFFSAVGLFVLVYRIAPDKPIRWRTALIAGTTCAVFFEVAKRGYAAYLRYAVRTEVLTPDAQLAGIMLLLAWFYLTAVVFLAAAEIADKHWTLGAP